MSLIKKKKILFIINSYSDYMDDFFKSLKNLFEIKIFLSKNNTDFTKYKAPTKKNYYLIKKNNFKKKINEFNPEIIILGGFKHFLIKDIIKYRKNKKVKILLWLERINKNFFFKNQIYGLIYKNLFKKFDGIFAIGTEALNFYKKFNKNTHLLPYNINFNKFRVNRYKDNKINILFVGQLIKRKGIELILELLDKLKNNFKKKINVTLVGNGPLKTMILKKKILHKNLKILNFSKRNKLIDIYRRNNVFLFPSFYDGWGVAPMEAAAAGMAIIISNKCGVSEYFVNKKNGIVINNNINDIYNAIRYLHDNPNEIQIYGNNNSKLLKNSLLNSSVAKKAFIKVIKNYE